MVHWKKGNGHIRTVEDKHRIEKLKAQGCYYIYSSDNRLKQMYISGCRSLAKNTTNRKIRHTSNIPNYGGYQKYVDYDWYLW
ncbi:hypothetical protein [Caproicibacterium amylolyticum]|uniref:Uncharacterized protein n=1 Tax=Caproicibacterium amylolyticum TaxID=2766537 RepID=A0A7G9WJW8_9FIRM|nr:hypothetical protein [Caproicibacterium amylolyticum]QNO18980.1 hypothetical protein H6X83_04980 [Caproicibacterium amylolyticum]